MADATRRPDLRASRRKAMRKLATFMAASPLLTHAEPRQQYPQRFPRVRSGRLAARTPSVTWQYLEWLRSGSKLPLIMGLVGPPNLAAIKRSMVRLPWEA